MAFLPLFMSDNPKTEDMTHFGTALLAKDPVWKLWRAIVLKLYPDAEEITSVDFSDLSQEAQTFFYVEELNREVCNGGFDQFFLNSGGSNAFKAKDALTTIGAVKTASLLSQALTIFPDGFPIADSEARWQILVDLNKTGNSFLEGLDSEYYDKIRTHKKDAPAEEDLWQLCVNFIEANISTPILKEQS